MSEEDILRASREKTPPHNPSRTAIQRFDNRRWWLARKEMQGTFEEHELRALAESAVNRLRSELENDHSARKRCDQYLERIRSKSGH